MEFQLFTAAELKTPEELIFEQSSLGKIHAQIPFKKLSAYFRCYKPLGQQGGRPAHLEIEGGLALMFLKHHLGFSDRLLIERLNTDLFLQLFCFTQIGFASPIRNMDLVGRWRRFFSTHLHHQSRYTKVTPLW